MNAEIKDIKAPIDLPAQLAWVWITLGIILAIVLVVGFIIWFFKRPKKVKTIEIPVMTPWEKAYKRLDNLYSKGLMNRAYLKPFYSDLSNIIRHYLEERFSIKAPEMTTEEFLESLRISPILDRNQQAVLKEFLLICDMVKFAKHESDGAEAQKSYELIKQLVDQTRGT